MKLIGEGVCQAVSDPINHMNEVWKENAGMATTETISNRIEKEIKILLNCNSHDLI